MPGWNEILRELNRSSDMGGMLDAQREKYFKAIHSITGRSVIAYYSGWLKNGEAPNVVINDQDMNAFMSVVYRLDKTKGLDLILHTPGGDLAATEGIVVYLKRMFHDDIRAIIPQISMSAGTLMAMACREIVMGEQSSLGPIDPQMGGIACQAVLDEFGTAVREVAANPASLGLWQTIICKYNPTFLTDCENAIKWSEKLADSWLRAVNPDIDLTNVKDVFLNHKNSHSHSRHLSKQDCKNAGLPVVDLENDQRLQDAVLSLHHCYMILFDRFKISKVVENNIGGRFLQNFGGK